MSDIANKRQYDWIFCGVISAMVLLTFGAVWWFDFIYFDDPEYTFRNELVRVGITWKGVCWAFLGFNVGNWHPLTTLTNMVDCQLWGLNPGAHHLTSLFLHLANVLVLYGFLKCLTREFWPSAVICTLWALHPMRVESVVWIAERKDVLSGLFGILSLWTYVLYARQKVARQSTAWRWYLATLICLGLGLLSKAMLVTWPFVMLLLDLWPLNRLPGNAGIKSLWANLKRLIWEKTPFFLFVPLVSHMTYLAQNSTGAVVEFEAMPLSIRWYNAMAAYFTYLWKTFYPDPLSVFYPHPFHWPANILAMSFLVIGGISVVALMGWRKKAWLFAGWFWFVGTLVPAIGLVQVGMQSMADRFTYLPAIGLLCAICWGLWECTRDRNWRVPLFAVLLIGGMGLGNGLIIRELQYWQNTFTLFERSIEVTPKNPTAHTALGAAYLSLGKLSRAKMHCQTSVAISIYDAVPFTNLGRIAMQEGSYETGIQYFQQALRVGGKGVAPRLELARAMEKAGRPAAEVIHAYRQGIAAKPNEADALNNLAWLLVTVPEPSLRNGPEAVQLATRACELTGNPKTVFIGTLAACLAEAGRFPEAVAMADRAIASARKNGEKELEETNLKLKAIYQAGKTVNPFP